MFMRQYIDVSQVHDGNLIELESAAIFITKIEL